MIALTEARRALLAMIREIKDNVEDVQKVQGRLTKDERVSQLKTTRGPPPPLAHTACPLAQTHDITQQFLSVKHAF